VQRRKVGKCEIRPVAKGPATPLLVRQWQIPWRGFYRQEQNSFCLLTEGWPGCVGLGCWLYLSQYAPGSTQSNAVTAVQSRHIKTRMKLRPFKTLARFKPSTISNLCIFQTFAHFKPSPSFPLFFLPLSVAD